MEHGSEYLGNEQDFNFKQPLKCRAEDDPVFSEWLNKKNQSFNSPETQNKIFKKIRCFLKETSGVSNKELAVFCVCWVDENLFSYEEFLRLHEMEKIDAVSIANFIKDIVLRLGFDSEKLRDQCYDGCAAMMTKKKELPAAMQIENDIQHLALSTHCHPHSLNLACGDGITGHFKRNY